MDGGPTSAVQRLRQRFEVLDGLARASPAGPARPASVAADSAGPGGWTPPRAPPAVVDQPRRTLGVGGPAAAPAAVGTTAAAKVETAASVLGSNGTTPSGEAKFASAARPSGERERVEGVIKSPAAGKRAPAAAIKSTAITKSAVVTNVLLAKKTDPTPAPAAAGVVNATTNGSKSPGTARRSASQLCNGSSSPSTASAADPSRSPASSAKNRPRSIAAAVQDPPTSPASSIGLPPSPVPSDAPPRPPKPGSDTSSSYSGGDIECEPGDYLVPDGVPPVPPREPLSPEWGGTRSPLVRRALPPPPSSGATLQQQAWFHSVDRTAAAALLERRGNGAFLVRPSRRGGAAAPFALTMLHAGQVFNFNVRVRSDGRFALGYHKKDEASFRSVEELVRHHQREPISLPTKARTCLTWYPSGGSGTP